VGRSRRGQEQAAAISTAAQPARVLALGRPARPLLPSPAAVRDLISLAWARAWRGGGEE